MIPVLLLALQTPPSAQPMVALRQPRLSAPLPATSWHCNLTGADGRSFALDGRFAEIPAGEAPDELRPTVVKAVAADEFKGPMQVRAGLFTENVRPYSMRADRSDGSSVTFNFQFLRKIGSYAVVSHYTPPKGDKIGVVAAYANGYCSSRFHEVGETETGQ